MPQVTQKTIAKFLGASVLLLGSQLAFSTDSGHAISVLECAKSPPCAKEILGAKIKDTIVKTGAATAVVTPLVIGGTAQPVADAVAPVVIVEGQGNVHYWNLSQNQTAQDLAKQRFYQTNCTAPTIGSVCGAVVIVSFNSPNNGYRRLSYPVGEGHPLYYKAYKIEDLMWDYGYGLQNVGPTFWYQTADGIWHLGPAIDLATLLIEPINAPTWESWPEADREKAVDLLTTADWGQLASTMPVAGKLYQFSKVARAIEHSGYAPTQSKNE
ncbi:MAG: hypothetical protein KME17_23420 [Cyanosarcina radialis HA8281-LM2]|nr:hypothetical protein [Cyanosarcina radialis HA8281-LM2]